MMYYDSRIAKDPPLIVESMVGKELLLVETSAQVPGNVSSVPGIITVPIGYVPDTLDWSSVL